MRKNLHFAETIIVSLSAAVLLAAAGCGKEKETNQDAPPTPTGELTVSPTAEPTKAPIPTGESSEPADDGDAGGENVGKEPVGNPALPLTDAELAALTQPWVREWTEMELAAAELVKQKSGKEIVWISCQDFDGNGSEEAFLIAGTIGTDLWEAGEQQADGTYEYYCGEIWYVSGEDAVRLQGEWDYVTPEFMSVKSGVLVKFEKLYMSSSQSKMYYIHDGGITAVGPEFAMGMEKMTDGSGNFSAVESAYDACSDGTGHTWKLYYFYFDEQIQDFREYGGVEITQEQFSAFAGGADVLEKIAAENGIVTSIYVHNYSNRREDAAKGQTEEADKTECESDMSGSMSNSRLAESHVKSGWYVYINYQIPYEGYSYAANRYLELALLPEGDGYALAWNAPEELKTIAEWGVHAPAMGSSIAVYPKLPWETKGK